MMEIKDLPAEMLLQVHQRLSSSALKEAVLVSRLWRAVGEDPILWEWCKVTVYCREDITNLASRRLRRIQEIRINTENWNTDDWEAFFLATMELSCLKKIDGRVGERGNVLLRAVKPDLFATSLARLEIVHVRGCTFKQIEALFNEMSRGTRLKKLGLWDHDLSQMDPGLFVGVLTKLEDVELAWNNITNDQMKALFTQIKDQSSLKRLVLNVLNVLNEASIHHLEAVLFARALAKIEDITIHSGITNNQIVELFTALAHENRVKKLDLRASDLDLSQVDPGQFTKALSRLEEASLNGYRTTNDQLQALFAQMSLKTQLKKLDLYGSNLSQLEPGLFSRALARMEDVRFSVTNQLTTNQLVAFFAEASHGTKLKALDISRVNLSSLATEVLTQAVTRLEAVTLTNVRLTDDQWLSLFTEMSQNTQIKKLEIRGNNVSCVDPQILARALNRLDEVTLAANAITPDQALAFFSEMAQNTKLKKLYLRYEDLSTLDPEILGNALTKIKEVDLWASRLSSKQITAILSHVLEADNNLRKLRLGTNRADVNRETVRKVKDKLKGEFRKYL